MREGAGGRARARTPSIGLVILLAFSSLAAMAPASSASVSGDLSLLVGVEPMENATYDRYTSFIVPEVQLRNDMFSTHSSREVKWQICSGDHTASIACPSGSASGLSQTGQVYGFQTTTLRFTNSLFQPMQEGVHTIFFSFTQTDSDPSDDVISYLFDFAAPLRDISINEVIFDTEEVYNSNTSYPISVDFHRLSWEAGQNATFGWELYHNGTLLSEQNETSIPPVATAGHWIKALPDFIAPFPGTFNMTLGLIQSDGDMNDWNDLTQITIIVNDSLDVWIEMIEPARGSGQTIEVSGTNYTIFPYGENSVRVRVGNIGFVDVNTSFSLEIYDMNATLLHGPVSCQVLMSPGESDYCTFEMPVTGELILRAEFTSFLEEEDINPSDNWFEVTVSSRHMPAYPAVSYPSEGQRFDSGDEIMFVGQVNPLGATPMNFTWRLNYEETLGYGQVMTTTLPMGEWLVTLTTRDALGQLDTAVRVIRVQNRISMIDEPWIVGGEAVMDEAVDYEFLEPEYPPTGYTYPELVGMGLSPMRIIEYDIEPNLPGVTDPGIVFVNSFVSLGEMLPDDFDRSTLVVMEMDSKESSNLYDLVFPSSFTYHDGNDTLEIHDESFGSGIYMIGGDLDNPEVAIENLTTIQLSEGYMRLEWEPTGELDDPYFAGWRIYRRTTFPFFWPYENASMFDSVIGSEVVDLGPTASSWNDPTPLPDDLCVSYLVMAVGRQGDPDHSRGAAAGYDGNTVQWQCGDAIPPTVTINSMNHVVTFDNSSDENIHYVELTWTYPEMPPGENVTWSLYRLEVIPSTLEHISPIEIGLWGEAGTTGTFIEGEDKFDPYAIRKMATYHYIMIPTDSVGNVDYQPVQDNIETVRVSNQFWDHNSYLIPPPPPEPEPPYGIEWLGEFYEYMENDAFKASVTFAFVVLLMNLLMIPIVINQTRGVRRLIKREKRKAAAIKEAMMAEGLSDDLDDFFD